MATYLNYPFDPELFLYNWKNAEDPVKTRLFESSAVVNNPEIQRLISNGSDFYTIPFYAVLGGTPENYDGATNITLDTPTGVAQNGIVYGRAHGWKAQDFVVDYNSGADPMTQIASQVAHYWNKQRQATMLGILGAVFGISGNAGWTAHTTDISSASTTVTAANKLGATTAGDAITAAVGDNADKFDLCFMHSAVANGLAGLQLLDFLKYTDENGVQRPLRIGTYNGLTVIVDDGCPVTAATQSVAAKYTTYFLGSGAIQFAPAPVKNAAEVTRDALTAGGYDALVTRVRETIHPNGFSFTKPGSGYTASPTTAQLSASANWSIVADPKNIALAKVVSNA